MSLPIVSVPSAYSKFMHIPVLLESSITGLAVAPRDVVIDGTFGGGGHSTALLSQYGDSIRLVCVDLDEHAKDRFEEKLGTHSNVTFVQSNFKDAGMILASASHDHADRVLLDLGTSTFQLLADDRGFSFNSDTPLAMTFARAGSHTGFTASDIVNTWQEESIADIIFGYGEDTSARRIARAIVAAREITPILTSKQLADVITAAIPRRGKTHPATKTFQALRITVNDELSVLKEALANWWSVLSPGGRIAVITFHSLEDRIVKRWMIDQEHKRVITKKPIIPTLQELQANPKSRSAKLRIIEKTL